MRGIALTNNMKSEFNTTLKSINFKDNSITSNGIIHFCNILKNEPSNDLQK